MSVELLRLRKGTSDQNSRAIERKVRSIMTTFTELDMHYEVERKSRTNIVLAPTYDEPMADFEGDVELLKEQLADDPLIMLHRSLSTVLNTGDSSSDDDGSDIGQYVQHRDWTFTSDDDFVPGQAASSTPQPAATYQYGRDTGNTAGLFGRPGTTVVSQRRPAQGQFAITPFQMDASSDDDSYHSTTRGVGDPGSGDDTDDTYFYQSDDSDDTSLDDSDDTSLDDSDSDDEYDFSDDSDDSDDDDDSFATAQSSAKNRVVDNAEMRTTAGEPETKEQRDLAMRIAKAIAATSSFTKADTLDKNDKPKPLSELMRMARVTSLWPVLSELQKDQYMQTTGVLAHDRHYIARNVQFGAPIRKKRPFVINAQGQKIVV
jgi:hypothetical protein